MPQQNGVAIFGGSINGPITSLIALFRLAKDKSRNVRRLLFKAGLWRTLATWTHYIRHNNKEFKHHLSLVLCVKDEGRYIQEWLEYYLLLGVDHFYIYNNNGIDNTRELIDSYVKDGLVTWHEYPGAYQQRNIYNDAVKKYRNETRWMSFIDIDEFIVPLQHLTIPAVLDSFGKHHQLLIHWVMYGSSHHKHYSSELVISRFKHHENGVCLLTKAIVNPRATVLANVHTHIVLGRTVNEKGHVLYRVSDGAASADLIRINHYVIKSKEEYLSKVSRGEVSRTKVNRNDAYFHNNDKNDIHDPIMSKYVPIIKSKISKRSAHRSEEVRGMREDHAGASEISTSMWPQLE